MISCRADECIHTRLERPTLSASLHRAIERSVSPAIPHSARGTRDSRRDDTPGRRRAAAAPAPCRRRMRPITPHSPRNRMSSGIVVHERLEIGRRVSRRATIEVHAAHPVAMCPIRRIARELIRQPRDRAIVVPLRTLMTRAPRAPRRRSRASRPGSSTCREAAPPPRSSTESQRLDPPQRRERARPRCTHAGPAVRITTPQLVRLPSARAESRR